MLGIHLVLYLLDLGGLHWASFGPISNGGGEKRFENPQRVPLVGTRRHVMRKPQI